MNKEMPTNKRFENLATKVSQFVGSPTWLIFSVILVLVWAPSGFFIGFDDTWQLIINTSTTILTFLMMSLLHTSQSKWEKDMERINLKQEHILRILEKETVKIRTDIEAKNASTNPITTLDDSSEISK